jgi:hypothetical protein
MRRTPATLLSFMLIVPLTACAAENDYPSLQRRPPERAAVARQTGSAPSLSPEKAPAPPAAPSPELKKRLAQLVEQARTAHLRFADKRANAERLVATGGGGEPGSDSWSVATVALSDLESARSDTMLALAELDELYASETIAASQTGDQTKTSAIASARDQVTALISEEDGVLTRLRGRMRG